LNSIEDSLPYVVVPCPQEQPVYSKNCTISPQNNNSADQVTWTVPITTPRALPNLNGDIYLYPGVGTTTDSSTFYGNKQTYPGPAPTLTAILGADIDKFKVLPSSYRITSTMESRTIQEILSTIPGISSIEAPGAGSYPEIAFAIYIWDMIVEYIKADGFADLSIVDFIKMMLSKRGDGEDMTTTV
jgi:hypothetical protein